MNYFTSFFNLFKFNTLGGFLKVLFATWMMLLIWLPVSAQDCPKPDMIGKYSCLLTTSESAKIGFYKSPPEGGKFIIYDDANQPVGELLSPETQYIFPPNSFTEAGTYNYTIETVVEGCTSVRQPYTFYIFPQPNPSQENICVTLTNQPAVISFASPIPEGINFLILDKEPNNYFRSKGQANSGTTQFTFPVNYFTQSGTYDFYLTSKNGECGVSNQEDFVKVTIHVLSQPQIIQTSVCISPLSHPVEINFLTSPNPGDKFVIYDDNNQIIHEVLPPATKYTFPANSFTQERNYTYYVETVSPQCSSIRTPVSFKVESDGVPVPQPSPSHICLLRNDEPDEINFTTSPPLDGKFVIYDNNNQVVGEVLPPATKYSFPANSFTQEGNYTYYVETIAEGCTTQRVPVTFYVVPEPTQQEVCISPTSEPDVINFTSPPPPNGKFIIYDNNNQVIGEVLPPATQYTFSANSFTEEGIYTYHVQTVIQTEEQEVCSSPRVSTTFRVVPEPPALPAISSSNLCNIVKQQFYSILFTAPPPQGGEYIVYDQNNTIIGRTSGTTVQISNLNNRFDTPGTYPFYVETVIPGCTSLRKQVDLNLSDRLTSALFDEENNQVIHIPWGQNSINATLRVKYGNTNDDREYYIATSFDSPPNDQNLNLEKVPESGLIISLTELPLNANCGFDNRKLYIMVRDLKNCILLRSVTIATRVPYFTSNRELYYQPCYDPDDNTKPISVPKANFCFSLADAPANQEFTFNYVITKGSEAYTSGTIDFTGNYVCVPQVFELGEPYYVSGTIIPKSAPNCSLLVENWGRIRYQLTEFKPVVWALKQDVQDCSYPGTGHATVNYSIAQLNYTDVQFTPQFRQYLENKVRYLLYKKGNNDEYELLPDNPQIGNNTFNNLEPGDYRSCVLYQRVYNIRRNDFNFDPYAAPTEICTSCTKFTIKPYECLPPSAENIKVDFSGSYPKISWNGEENPQYTIYFKRLPSSKPDDDLSGYVTISELLGQTVSPTGTTLDLIDSEVCNTWKFRIRSQCCGLPNEQIALSEVVQIETGVKIKIPDPNKPIVICKGQRLNCGDYIDLNSNTEYSWYDNADKSNPPIAQGKDCPVISQTGNLYLFAKNGTCERGPIPFPIQALDFPTGGTITSTNTTFCKSDELSKLTLSGAPGTFSRWEKSEDNGANFTTITENASTPVYEFNRLEKTTIFRAYSTTPCGEVYAEIKIFLSNIVLEQDVEASVNPSPSGNCHNGTLVVKGKGGVEPYQYSIDGITYQSSGTFTGLAVGNYTVQIKDASNKCTAEGTFKLECKCDGTVSNIHLIGDPVKGPGLKYTAQVGWDYTGGAISFEVKVTFPNPSYPLVGEPTITVDGQNIDPVKKTATVDYVVKIGTPCPKIQVQVRAVCSPELKTDWITTTINIGATCTAPVVTNPLSNITATGATVSWTASPEATMYDLRIIDGNNLATIPNVTSPYNITSLEGCKIYEISVVAKCNCDVVTESNKVTCITPPDVSNLNLAATFTPPNSISVNYNPAGDGITSYTLKWTKPDKTVANLPLFGELPVIVPNVSPCGKHQFEVTAKCTQGTGSVAKEVTVDGNGCVSEPCPEITINQNGTPCNKTTFSWAAVSGATRYIVQYQKKDNPAGITQVPTTNTSLDVTLETQTDYQVMVIAEPNDGSKICSYKAFTTCPTEPSCISITKVRQDIYRCTVLDLNWDRITGVNWYRIYWRKKGDTEFRYANWSSNSFAIGRGSIISDTEYEVKVFTIPSPESIISQQIFDACPLQTYKTCIPQIENEPLPCPLITAITNVSCSSVNIKWNPVSGANGYTVEVRRSGSDQISTYNAGSDEFTLTSLNGSTAYEVRVISIPTGNNTAITNCSWRPFTTGNCNPNNNCVSATASVFCDRAVINWNAVPNAGCYRLSWRNIDNSGSWQSVNVTSGNTFTILALSPNFNYEYKLAWATTCSSGFNGTSCSAIRFKTPVCQPSTDCPVVEVFPGDRCTEVNVNWNLLSGVTDYRLEFRMIGTNEITNVSGPGVLPPFKVTNLLVGSVYQFRVIALPGNVTSCYWVDFATCAPPINCPILEVKGTSSCNKVTLHWNPLPFASYKLEFREMGGAITTVTGPEVLSGMEVTNLLVGRRYEFRIIDINSGIITCDWVEFTTCTPNPECPTVEILAGSSCHEVKVYWDLIFEATGYKIEFRKAGGITLSITGPQVYSGFSVTNLLPSTVYEFRVIPLPGGNVNCPWVSFTTCTPKPKCPSLSVQQGKNCNEVILNWNTVPNIITTSYEIQFRKVGQLNVTSTRRSAPLSTFMVTNLLPGTTYQFRVLALPNGSNTCDWVSFTTCKIEDRCLAAVVNTGSTCNKATFSWNPVPTASCYILSWKPVNENTWTTRTNIKTPSITVTDLIPNTEYEYKLAWSSTCSQGNASGCSPLRFNTNGDCNTPECTPITGLQAKANATTLPGTINVSWTNVSYDPYYEYIITYGLSGSNSFQKQTQRTNSFNFPVTLYGNYTVKVCKIPRGAISGECGCANTTVSYTDGCTEDLRITGLVVSSTLPESIDVSWDAIPNYVGYRVRYRKVGAENWENSIVCAGANTGLYASEGTYEVEVCALDRKQTKVCHCQTGTVTVEKNDCLPIQVNRPYIFNDPKNEFPISINYFEEPAKPGVSCYEVILRTPQGQIGRFKMNKVAEGQYMFATLIPYNSGNWEVYAVPCNSTEICSPTIVPADQDISNPADQECRNTVNTRDLSILNISNTSVRVQWNVNTPRFPVPTQYRVRLTKINTGTVTFSPFTNSLSEEITGLEPNTAYKISVCSYTQNGRQCHCSIERSFTTSECGCAVPQYTPSISQSCELGKGKITLTLPNQTVNYNEYTKIELGYRKTCPTNSNTYEYVAIENLQPGSSVTTPPLTLGGVDGLGCYNTIVRYTCANGCTINGYLYGTTITFACPLTAGRIARVLMPEGAGSVVGTDTTVAEGCSQPLNIYYEAFNDSVIVHWTPVQGASAYYIYLQDTSESPDNDSTFVPVNWITVNGSDSMMTIYTTNPCAVYDFGIVTVCSDTNVSTWQTSYLFRSQASCKAPQFTQVFNITSTTASVSWQSSSGATQYLIRYRKPGGAGTGTDWDTLIINGNQTETLLQDLLPGTNYELQIATICCNSDSSIFDSTQTFTTRWADCGVPQNIHIVTGIDTANVSWKPVLGATRYRVAWKKTNQNNWSYLFVSAPDTNFTLLGITLCAEYLVNVTAICGDTLPSDWMKETPFSSQICEAPQNAYDYTLNEGETIIEWEASPTALSYNMEYRLVGDTLWTIVSTDSNRIILQYLQPDSRYEYRIQSNCCEGSISTYGKTDTFATLPNNCIQRPRFSSISTFDNGVMLTWNNLPNISGYFLSWHDQENEHSYQVFIEASDTTLSYFGLDVCKKYEFEIRAVCDTIPGIFADIREVSFEDTCVAPYAQITYLPTDNSVFINWLSGMTSIAYQLEYRKVGEHQYQKIDVANPPYLLTGLEPNTTYEYHVRSICCNDTGNFGNIDIFTTLPSLCHPTEITRITIDRDQALVQWATHEGVWAYVLKHRVDTLNATENVYLLDSSSTQLRLIDLDPCVEHHISLQVLCTESDRSITVDTIINISRCITPEIFTINNDPNGSLVTWENIPGATTYEVSYQPYGDTLWTSIWTNNTEYLLQNLREEYFYVIRIRTVLCNGDTCNNYGYSYLLTRRNCPRVIVDTSWTNGNNLHLIWRSVQEPVILTWSANTPNAPVRQRIFTIPDTSFIIENLSPCDTYLVQLTTECRNLNVLEPESLYVTVNVCTSPEYPYFRDIQPNRITVKWPLVAGALGYQIRYRQGGNLNWTTLTTAADSLTLTGLLELTDYEIQVRSICCSQDTSDFSPIYRIRTFGCPTPTNLVVSNPTTTTLFGSWNASQNASFYQVQYRRIDLNSWQSINNILTPYTSIDNLLPGTTYVVRVRANCGYGFTGWSNLDTLATLTCVVPPNIVTGNATETTFRVTWNHVNNATSYSVRYRQIGLNTWTTVNNITDTFRVVTNLQVGTAYEVQVRATCGLGNSAWSNSSNITTLTCAVPPNIVTGNATETSFRVTWNHVQNATSYSVRYRQVGLNSWTTVNNITDTFRVVTNLQVGTAYEIQVRATCTLGNSAWSNSFNMSTLTCVVPPSIVTDNATETTFRVTWDRVQNATSYSVRYRRPGLNSWTTVNNIIDTFRVVTGLLNGTDYEVQVRATCGLGTSNWSNTDTIATVLCATPPDVTAGNSTETSFDVVWNSIVNANYYQLRYRSIGNNSWHTLSNLIDTFRVVTGLTPGTSYELQVRSFCTSATSAWSTPDTIATRACVAPPVLTVTNITETQFTVQWTNVVNATAYQVRYRKIGTSWRTVSNLINTSYTALNLIPGEFYEVRVRAVCNLGRSEWSNTDTIQTINCDTPLNVAFSNLSPTSFTANWNTVPNATAYTLRYRRLGLVSWQTINNIPTNSRTVTGLVNGSSYEVMVRSVCGNGYSLWSAMDTVNLSGIRQSSVTTTEVWSDFSLYPNPNKGNFTIALTTEEVSSLKVEVFDVTGRLVYTNTVPLQKGGNEIPFELKGISSGIYSLRVNQGNQNKLIKLVIE